VGVLLEGDAAGVGERAAHLRGLLGAGAETSPDAPAWWGSTGPPDGHNGAGRAGTLIRVGFWAAALPAVLAAIDGAAVASGLDPLVAGSAAAGVIYVALGAGVHPAAAAAFVASLREALARGGGGRQARLRAGAGQPAGARQRRRGPRPARGAGAGGTCGARYRDCR